MNWDHEVYLLESEQKVINLQRLVNGRPVGIMASGPSIVELESRITELSTLDICWFGFNTFTHEDHILSKIGRKYSIYMDSCRENIPMTISRLKEYLGRQENNLFISTYYRDTFALLSHEDKEYIFKRYEKLLFFYLASTHDIPSTENPLHFIEGNSLQMAICIAIISRTPKIVLFGADGGSSSKECYYRQKDYHGPVPSNQKLLQDTINHFNPTMPISIQNTSKAYDIPIPIILNASMGSLYTPLSKCDYNTAFRNLGYV